MSAKDVIPEIIVRENIITASPTPLPKLKGLGHSYFHKMKEIKDRVAQTDAFTGEQCSYGEILEKSVRAAISMRGRGLKAKDIFMICSLNNMDLFIPYYAGLFLGAVPTSIDPAISLTDAVYFLKLVKPKVLFIGPEAVKLIEDALAQTKQDISIVVYGDTTRYTKLSEILTPSPEETVFAPYEVEDLKETAAIVFTSGSTGLPNGACLTHLGLLGSAWRHTLVYPGDVHALVNSNLYWISQTSFMPVIIFLGANRIIYPKHDYETVLEVVSRNKVNMLCLNSHQVMTMFTSRELPKDLDWSNLKFLLIIGGAVTEKVMVRARGYFKNALVAMCYGQTEINGTSFEFNYTFDQDIARAKPTSVGKPRPGYSYKIVDLETGKSLGPKQPGELLVKTDFVMNGYHDKDSSHVWNSEGYLKTGDILYYDEEYCFYYVDRIKDIMKYKMWHISPTKVEQVLATHPAVQDCIVSSRVHEVDQDILVGVVTLKKDYVGKVQEIEIQSYVNERMDDLYQLRGGVKFVESIPYTITGKPNRRLIRQMLAQ